MAMLKGIVDRIEGDTAFIETAGSIKKVPAAALPEGAGEGAHVIIDNGHIVRDEAEEKRTRTRVSRLEDELFR